MKKLAVFLLLFLILPSAYAEWYHDSESIVTGISMSSTAEIVPTTPSGYIDSAKVNMTFFPKQTGTQELLKLKTVPLAEFTGDSLIFKWSRPEEFISFSLNANVMTTNSIPQLRQKAEFPVRELPEEIIVYTKPSPTIDSNDEAIVRLASELAKGQDDLYVAVFKIADWTKNNINYNLSTLTADVSQKASWVLENRQGVCDELTSLFIALSRAVGIPARFVSGISYTNSPLFPENWGPHGWAEVYFPDYGWIPFDVTYGQFGWVDPTHVKFKESIDSDEPSTYYSWLGRNADLKTGKLDIKTEVIEKKGYYKTPLNLEASFARPSTGFGSYNLLEADIENLNDFYFATELMLSKPKEIKIEGRETRSVLLLPYERKKVHWLLNVEDDLDSRYSYTFPFIISTSSGIKTEASFASSSRERIIPFEEMKKISDLHEEENERAYSGNVILECAAPKKEFYDYEEISVFCTAKNTGNIYIDADICLESECRKMGIGISQSKNASFVPVNNGIGLMQLPIVLKSDLVSKTSYAEFIRKDKPSIGITGLEFPKNASYRENLSISFTLSKESSSKPKNVEVILSANSFEKRWSIDELAESRKFILDFGGKQLKYGENKFSLDVGYSDDLGRKYNASSEFQIELAEASLFERLLLGFNGFVQSISSWFLRFL